MNRFKIAFATALFLGVSGLVYAQEPAPDDKPPKQEAPRPENETARPRQDEPKQQEPEKQENAKPSKDQKEQEKEQPKAAHEQNGRPGQQETVEQSQQGHARPAGKSAHIPDQKFRASFGRQHSFAPRQIIQTTTVVAGQTQFVYTGYTFVILDPWPSEWLYSDDCYIDYVDGEYFLFDVAHPGIRIALFVQG